MLFVDFSLDFNSISLNRLVNKLQSLHLGTPLCLWIKDFLTNRPQHVKLGILISSAITLNTGVPQGCVLIPVLYPLYYHNCTPTYSSNAIIMFPDDATIVSLVSNNNEPAYREEAQVLSAWCKDNNLNLKQKKTKEIYVDFRKTTTQHTWIEHRWGGDGGGCSL